MLSGSDSASARGMPSTCRVDRKDFWENNNGVVGGSDICDES